MSRRANGKKSSKFVTKRELPRLIMGIAETKRLVTQASLSAMDSANPIQVTMNLIDRGNGRSARDGDQVQCHSAYVSFGFSPSANNPVTRPHFMRVIMYTPLDPQVAALNVLPFVAAPQGDNIYWYDKTFPVGWTNSVQGAHGEIKKKWKPYMRTTWGSSTNTDFIKGRVNLMITTDCPVGEIIGTSFEASLYFKDI